MKTIYVLFSSTNTCVGSVIRKITRFSYNHVSIGFDLHSDVWFSFARFNRHLPTVGGFVKETHLRLCDGGDISVCVCAYHVSEEQYEYIRDIINLFSQTSESAYNYLAAALTPMNIYVSTPNTYTCVGFVSYCLGFKLTSIEQLFNILSKNIVYCGNYMSLVLSPHREIDFFYFRHLGYLTAFYLTLNSWKHLVRRYLYSTRISYIKDR